MGGWRAHCFKNAFIYHTYSNKHWCLFNNCNLRVKIRKNCITSLEQIKVYKDPILFELFSGEPFLVRLNLENSGASGKDFLSYAPLVGYSAVLIDLNV